MVLVPTAVSGEAEARVALLGSRVLALAETLGAADAVPLNGFSAEDLQAALDGFARLGVGRALAVRAKQAGIEELAGLLQDVIEAVGQSPLPAQEWSALVSLLGEDLLARLVAVSPSSLARYRTGTRATPDLVASRLHTVALIASDLAGSYNSFGIRRWFTRSRSALGGVAPADLLVGEWEPESEPVERVRALASSLLG
jgi:hypothetical protein